MIDVAEAVRLHCEVARHDAAAGQKFAAAAVVAAAASADAENTKVKARPNSLPLRRHKQSNLRIKNQNLKN